MIHCFFNGLLLDAYFNPNKLVELKKFRNDWIRLLHKLKSDTTRNNDGKANGDMV